MTWWSWAILGVLLLFSELATPGGFFLLFFGIGALIVSPLVWAEVLVQDSLQWAVFPVISILLLALFRKKLLARLPKGYNRSDTDSMIGGKATTIDALSAEGSGKVHFRGTSWSARNVSGSQIASGVECEVVAVDGLTLVVK
jgi:membrane protein implicated in regulation of membrane protease activity